MSHSDREGRDFLGRLLGRSRHDARQAGSRSEPPAQLNLDDIQGFILRGYRMPLVRHFLLTVENPGTARTLLGRLVSGDESDAPQIRRPGIGMLDSSPGRAMTQPTSRAGNPITVSTWVLPGLA
jgi:hypothetical protein